MATLEPADLAGDPSVEEDFAEALLVADDGDARLVQRGELTGFGEGEADVLVPAEELVGDDGVAVVAAVVTMAAALALPAPAVGRTAGRT